MFHLKNFLQIRLYICNFQTPTPLTSHLNKVVREAVYSTSFGSRCFYAPNVNSKAEIKRAEPRVSGEPQHNFIKTLKTFYFSAMQMFVLPFCIWSLRKVAKS